IRLRLDSEEAALADLGGDRRAIAPRHPERSELVKRVSAADADMRMPPASSGRSLGQDEIALLTEWIAQGAPWQTHWAFIPPPRPAPPPQTTGGGRGTRLPISSWRVLRKKAWRRRPKPTARRSSAASRSI